MKTNDITKSMPIQKRLEYFEEMFHTLYKHVLSYEEGFKILAEFELKEAERIRELIISKNTEGVIKNEK